MRSTAKRSIKDVLKARQALHRSALAASTGPTITSIAPYAFDPGAADVAAGRRAGFACRQRRTARSASRLAVHLSDPGRTSASDERIGAGSPEAALSTSASTCSSKSFRSKSSTRRIAKGDFEAIADRHDQRPDASGRPYIFWASRPAVQGTTTCSATRTPKPSGCSSVLRTSTNEAAVRSATRRLQRVLLDDPPALFLAWNERARAVRRDFIVVRRSRTGSAADLWRWTPPTDAADSLDAVKKISTRFALLMAAAAVVPLLAYGAVSICRCARRAAGGHPGNLNVARRAAEQIELYVTSSVKILKAVAADLQQTGSSGGSRTASSRTSSSSFPSSRELTLLDENGTADRLEPPRQADRQRFPAPTASTSTAR